MVKIVREHERTHKRKELTPEQREKIARARRERPKRDRRELVAALTAEFVGTFIVTLGTVGPSAVERGLGLHVGYAVLYACTGVATAIVIYALGAISGAHTNPCTTLAFALRGDFAWSRVPPYVLAQFVGAVAAGAFVLAALHPARDALVPLLARGAWPAFWMEIVLTTILLIVAIATANEARFIGPQSALANGGTTVLLRWIGGWISSGSMNPSRTLGPAILVGGTSAWWVFVAAPAAGIVIAVALVWVLCGAPNEQEARKSGG